MDLQAFLAERDDCLLLSFRGSIASLNNWVGNFNAEQTNLGSSFAIGDVGQTHRGFTYGLTRSLWMQILNAIKELNAFTQPLFITGHSLGGALGVLAAAAFYYSLRRPVTGLYTFGQPRVGDMKFAVTFDSQLLARHYRFVNAEDIVPHVPPPIFPVFVPPHLWPPTAPVEFLTYNHTGRVLRFDDHGSLSNSEATWDIDVAKLSLMTLEERVQALVGEVNLIIDHDIALYRQRIAAYIDGGMKPELHW